MFPVAAVKKMRGQHFIDPFRSLIDYFLTRYFRLTEMPSCKLENGNWDNPFYCLKTSIYMCMYMYIRTSFLLKEIMLFHRDYEKKFPKPVVEWKIHVSGVTLNQIQTLTYKEKKSETTGMRKIRKITRISGYMKRHNIESSWNSKVNKLVLPMRYSDLACAIRFAWATNANNGFF